MNPLSIMESIQLFRLSGIEIRNPFKFIDHMKIQLHKLMKL